MRRGAGLRDCVRRIYYSRPGRFEILWRWSFGARSYIERSWIACRIHNIAFRHIFAAGNFPVVAWFPTGSRGESTSSFKFLLFDFEGQLFPCIYRSQASWKSMKFFNLNNAPSFKSNLITKRYLFVYVFYCLPITFTDTYHGGFSNLY